MSDEDVESMASTAHVPPLDSDPPQTIPREADTDVGPEAEADGDGDAEPNAQAQDRREGAARAFFSVLCEEPLASAATVEALEQFAKVASEFSDDDIKAADERLLEIARATAGRHGLSADRGPQAE